MKFQAYPSYKASGIEWLGDVPKHWETKKVTYGFSRIGSGTTPKSDSEDFYDGDIPWVTTSELRENIITNTKVNVTRSAIAAYSSLRLYPSGTLLFAMYGATIGRLGILGIPATLNQACCAFSDPTLFDTRFVFYWLLMRRPILISLSTGGGQPNLSQDDLRQIRISIPPPSEQIAIASFLDQETSRTDQLIHKKKELIERLKEKRSTLISRTVTRGLPPAAARAAGLPENSSLKDSGIEWLGEIPEHWDAKKLGYGAYLQGGYAYASEKFDSEGVPVVRMNNLKRGVLDTSYASCIAPENCLDDFALTEGDLLCGMSGSIGETGSLGNFALVKKCDLPAQLNQRVGRFRIIDKSIKLCFLHYVIQTRLFYDQVLLCVTGTAQFNVSSEQVQSVKITFPPPCEQTAIAAYLDQETAKLDALISKVEEAIERLQEYRTALITAAVTGKIDLRKSAV